MVPTTASGVNASFTALQRPPTDTSDEVGQTVRRAPSRAYGHAVGMLLHHIARSHYLAKPSDCLTRKQPCVPSSHVRSPDGPKHLAAAYHRRPPFEDACTLTVTPPRVRPLGVPSAASRVVKSFPSIWSMTVLHKRLTGRLRWRPEIGNCASPGSTRKQDGERR